MPTLTSLEAIRQDHRRNIIRQAEATDEDIAIARRDGDTVAVDRLQRVADLFRAVARELEPQ